jgi:hypothetical protein
LDGATAFEDNRNGGHVRAHLSCHLAERLAVGGELQTD